MNSVQARILFQVKRKPDGWVFSAKDFLTFGTRAAVDQALSRLAKDGRIRRVARGLYDRPRHSAVLNAPAPARLDAVMSAVARRDDVTVVPDGSVHANRLGLTTAVPARPSYWTTGPSRTVAVGKRSVRLKHMPNWLRHWAKGHPGAPVVMAMHSLRSAVNRDDDVPAQLQQHLPSQVVTDLQRNISKMPTWMHASVRRLTADAAI